MPFFKFLQRSPQPTPTHSFLAIVLIDGIAQVILWEVANGKIQVGAASERISWNSEDSCLAAVDQALIQLGTSAENVHQTLFALSTDWVNAYGITAARKPLFQRLSKDLSLQPVGFVVITEALVQYILETQSAPLHGFLVEVAATDMVVALVKNGKIGQIERVGKSSSPISDFTEALARFHEETLPPKLMIFSSVLTDQEVEEIRQQLFEQDWKTSHAFTQTPVIEVMNEQQLSEAIVLTGGRAYAEQKHLVPAGAFHAGQAVAASAEPTFSESTRHLPSDGSLVDDTSEPKVQVVVRDETPSATEEAEMAVLHHPPHPPLAKFVIIGVVLGLLLLAAATFAFAQFGMKADVFVGLDHKRLAKDVTLKLDPSATASDVSQLLLKASTVTKDASGELSVPATGKKIIGDKAKGQVTIFNRTTSEKSFSAGTVLSNGKFQFTLDDTVNVASASTGSNFQTNPGTVDTKVTAKDIGPDYNLTKDKDFTIDSFSTDTYVARSTADFAGGSSREILAVSQQDRDKLLTELKRSLADQAYQDLKSTAESGMFIVPTNQIKISNASYSAELGKETNTVSLRLTVSAQALQYQTSDLQPFAQQLLSQDVPAEYHLNPESIELLSSPQESSSSSAAVKLDANISGVATPDFEPQSFISQLLGKSINDGLSLIRQKTGVKSVTVVRTPSWLEWLNPRFPTNAQNVHVTLGEDK